MGYRIVYGSEIRENKLNGNRYLRIQLMTAVFFLLGCILARLLWPEGTATLQKVLLPGPVSVTEQAFSQLVEQLRDGEPVGEAVESFCRFVIVHGTAN